jgi:peptidoglycan glycosyltransferase
VAADWKALNQDAGRPLVDRGVQGLYPPGSTFKAIVAAGALQEGTVTPQTVFVDTGSWIAGGYRVNNYGGKAYGEHTFTQAFAESINTTFAKVGVELGADRLSHYAEAFGFNVRPPWPLGGARSFFPPPGAMDTAHVAQASIGQGKVLATPLEMALVAAGIANGGVIMRPTVVEEWRDYRQTVLERPQPEVWLTAITPQTAATERGLMIEVVREGTGTKAALPNVQVAGKTGTAEVERGAPHAWFIGFAPADHPEVAVAVLVEHGGTGGSVAAPIARDVIAAALGR